MKSRLVQGFVFGLWALSLAGLAQATPYKEGYKPPTAPSCLDLQHSWDVLDGLIRVKLDAIYGPGYPGLAGLENAILHHRPDCPVSITPLDLSGDLTDFVLNHLNTDPPAGDTDPPPITLAGNDPPSWNDGSWGNDGFGQYGRDDQRSPGVGARTDQLGLAWVRNFRVAGVAATALAAVNDVAMGEFCQTPRACRAQRSETIRKAERECPPGLSSRWRTSSSLSSAP